VRRWWWGEVGRAYRDAAAFALPFPVVVEMRAGRESRSCAGPRAASLYFTVSLTLPPSLSLSLPPSVPSSFLSLPAGPPFVQSSSASSSAVLGARQQASASVVVLTPSHTLPPSFPPSLPPPLSPSLFSPQLRVLPAFLSPSKEPQAAAALVSTLLCVVVRGRPLGRSEGGREGEGHGGRGKN